MSYVCVYSIDSLSLPLSLFLRNIDKVHAGIGDKFAMLIQWLTTFIAGFVVGFIRGWQLALLLAFITPIMGVAGAVFFRVRGSCMIIMWRERERQRERVCVCVCVVIVTPFNTVD